MAERASTLSAPTTTLPELTVVQLPNFAAVFLPITPTPTPAPAPALPPPDAAPPTESSVVTSLAVKSNEPAV